MFGRSFKIFDPLSLNGSSFSVKCIGEWKILTVEELAPWLVDGACDFEISYWYNDLDIEDVLKF